jgi:hypothetical protein
MTPATFNGQPTRANPPPPSAMPLAQIEPSSIVTDIPESSGQSGPDFGVSGTVETVKSPRVDKDASESPQVINSQLDKTDGQVPLSTRGQGCQKSGKSTPKSTTKKTAKRKAPKARKSKTRPPTPEGFEARLRDNRWQLFRLHGKKLSANGKPMWNRTYIGSFTTEGLKRLYEREQQRLEDESTGQRANVVSLPDRKRGGRDLERRSERARKTNP